MAVRKRTSKRTVPPARARRTKSAKPAARKTAKAGPDGRRTERETLRLRSIEPTFTVNDLETSLRFYTDVLGFIVADRYASEGGALTGVMLKAGACRIGLAQDDWKKGRDRQKGDGFRLWQDRSGHRRARGSNSEERWPPDGRTVGSILGRSQSLGGRSRRLPPFDLPGQVTRLRLKTADYRYAVGERIFMTS